MKSVPFRVVAVALTALLAAGGLASSEDRNDSKQVVIVSATPDLVNENLTLAGASFGTSSGVVTLDTLPVTVISWADTQVVVKLPAEVIAAPGSYLVTLTRSRPRGRRSQKDDDDDDDGKRTGVFIATVGAVGPEGEKGDIGPEGKVGPQGLQGDKGDQGIQGIQGVEGVKGDKGDTGAQGPREYRASRA